VKIAPLPSLMLLSATAASAQNLVAPEVVQLENLQVEGDMQTVYVGNANNHYLLYCNIKAPAGCITPEENKNYLLFNANTRWKMPGAKDFLTLAFIQDWTIKYNQGENIGLVPEELGCGRPDCVAGHVGLELRNVDAKYPFERSNRFPESSRSLATETIRV
jgi:hypothetical protein